MVTDVIASSQSAEGPAQARAPRASDDLHNLDFLRAVAVLLVFLGHLTYFCGMTTVGPLYIYAMGGLGVRIFFVHTCFVLMLSLERQWKNQARAELFLSFMVRRIFRIYPLSVTAVVLVAGLRLPLAGLRASGEFIGIPLDAHTIISNLLLTQSIAPRGVGTILGPMWSLPYEMAMYPLLPLLFLFLYPTKSALRVLIPWSASILVALVFLAHPRRADSNPFLLFIPCFMPGVIAYQLQRARRSQLPGFLWPGVVIGLVLLFLYKQNLLTDDWIKSWSLCLALGLAVPCFAQISARWLVVPSHLIAKYSYGIYLSHFFCIWLAFVRLRFLPLPARIAIFVALVIALPVFFYHLLEEPMVQMGKRVGKYLDTVAARFGSAHS